MDAITLHNTSTFEKDHFGKIAEVLDNDGLILYPTDTIWGLGCDATNPVAIERVFKLKKRDRNKPFVLIAKDIDMVKNYVESLHPRLETLMLHHRRPLTVIYEKGINLPYNAVAFDGSVAIRVVSDPFCRNLMEEFRKPLIATSANVTNQPFPSIFGEISSEVIQKVDYIAYHRRNDKTPKEPSVIVKYNQNGELIFLRE